MGWGLRRGGKGRGVVFRAGRAEAALGALYEAPLCTHGYGLLPILD